MSHALWTGGAGGQHERRITEGGGRVTHPVGPGMGGGEVDDEGLARQLRDAAEEAAAKSKETDDKKKKKKKKKKSKKYASSSSSSSSSESGLLCCPVTCFPPRLISFSSRFRRCEVTCSCASEQERCASAAT